MQLIKTQIINYLNKFYKNT